jgi:hypothetical protein
MPKRTDKPAFPPRLFWEYRFNEIRWRKDYTMVMTRVLERGNDAEYEELIRFYGKERIIHALKNELKYFPDYILGRITSYFALQPEDLRCSTYRQDRKGHWI